MKQQCSQNSSSGRVHGCPTSLSCGEETRCSQSLHWSHLFPLYYFTPIQNTNCHIGSVVVSNLHQPTWFSAISKTYSHSKSHQDKSYRRFTNMELASRLLDSTSFLLRCCWFAILILRSKFSFETSRLSQIDVLEVSPKGIQWDFLISWRFGSPDGSIWGKNWLPVSLRTNWKKWCHLYRTAPNPWWIS